MTEKNLDNRIREALGNFEAKYDESSWDLLSQRMATDSELNSATAEDDFDLTVKTKINNINPNYEPAHWKIMAERIQQEFSLRRRLIRYKVAEIGLVLLIIFTIINLFPGKVTGLKQAQNSDKNIPTAESSSYHDSQKESAGESSLQGNNYNLLSSKTHKANAVEEELQQLDRIIASTATQADNNFISERKKQLYIAPLTEQSKKISAIERSGFYIANFRDDIDEIQLLETTDAGALMYSPQPVTGKSTAIRKMASLLKMRVSMFSGADYNYIETPYDPIFDLDRKNRIVRGYQGGIAFSFKVKDLEIETGSIYSNKEYDPKIPTEFLDNLQGPPVAVSFDKIQLNMLEVPLNFRFFFGGEKRWRFYGQTGASVHMALVANYDKFPYNLNFPSAAPSGSAAPKLESKKFSDGLFEGGSFEENSYFTANLGFGVERRVNTRWSLFMQPNIKAYLLPTYNNGLGPNQDRISSFSVLAGARVSLW